MIFLSDYNAFLLKDIGVILCLEWILTLLKDIVVILCLEWILSLFLCYPGQLKMKGDLIKMIESELKLGSTTEK